MTEPHIRFPKLTAAGASLALVLLLQGGAALWWSADISARVEALEKADESKGAALDALSGVPEQLDGLRRDVRDLRELLDALLLQERR